MRDMLLQTVNLLIGPIPDILYFTFFIICTKKLKKRKILLTVLIALTYITCIVIYKYLASVGINLISDFLSQK